jgi:para-nitrobenzyl esterase
MAGLGAKAAASIVAVLALACGSVADNSPSSPTGGGAGGAADVGGEGGLGGAGEGGGGATGGGGGTACPTDVSPEPGLVITEYGPVRGELAGETYVFKGIPFAAPPVDSLRFRPPEPPACIDGVLYASAFGSWCPQPNGVGGVRGDEDCLTLNVWAPADPPASPRPVMVWIHGGGNRTGASGRGGDDNPLFNGQPYVEQAEVVFVSINYRLGALGFIAHPALTAEDPNGSSGNNGLLDQIAALEWVRDNIAHFGGDPEQVMVFGQSAGAADICALMTSPLSAGLFDRALMSSGACVSQPLEQREASGAALASSLGCESGDVADCLRATPAADIVSEQPGSLAMINPLGLEALPFGPTVDGYVLPKDPLQALSDGDQHDVPFVLGSNAMEASLAVQPVVTLNQYEQIVYDHYGQADGDLVLQMYDPQSFPTPRRALIALSTDASWTCPARRAARAAAASQESAVYRYFFTHALDGPAVQGLGAFHALDVYFVFQHSQAMTYTLDPAELALSEDMLGYWSRFAITGDPNGGDAVTWPSYGPASDPHLVLDTTIVSDADVRPARCDLLDSLL